MGCEGWGGGNSSAIIHRVGGELQISCLWQFTFLTLTEKFVFIWHDFCRDQVGTTSGAVLVAHCPPELPWDFWRWKCCCGLRPLCCDPAEEHWVVRMTVPGSSWFGEFGWLKHVNWEDISQSVGSDFAMASGFLASCQPWPDDQSDGHRAAGRWWQHFLHCLLSFHCRLQHSPRLLVYVQDLVHFLNLHMQLISLVKRRACLCLPLHTHMQFV